MQTQRETFKNTTQFLKDKGFIGAKIAIILGSGLGKLCEQLQVKTELSYHEIPGFSESTVSGHAGKLYQGQLENKEVLVMSGRFHLYEGHEASAVSLPIRVFKDLGINTLIVTNAAGGVNQAFQPGDLMIISDHIGFFALNPLRGPNLDEYGPRFPDMSEAYNKNLRLHALKVAKEMGIVVKTGVYFYAKGPTYETPSEIKMLEKFGVDAVGMSTVPEVIVARHCGMDVLGISCITNMASGILNQPLSHDEVKETADRVAQTFSALVKNIVQTI